MLVKNIPIEKVYANWFQPRKNFDKEKIKELAESILSNGLINPITVKKWRDGKYLIVSGERRWRSHKVARLKEVQAFVKEYEDDGQFMIDSLIENIHREDLTSMDKAKFIQKIWKKMGKPPYHSLGMKLSVSEHVIQEHLSLVDKSTPKEVKKAVDEGKLAMRSASMISKLPEKEQVRIAQESMKRETGIGRSEVQELVKHPTPEPLSFEETIDDVGDEILSNLHEFKSLVDNMFKKFEIDNLSKSKADKLMTTAGLHMNHYVKLLHALKERGAKPHPLIMALIKANGKV